MQSDSLTLLEDGTAAGIGKSSELLVATEDVLNRPLRSRHSIFYFDWPELGQFLKKCFPTRLLNYQHFQESASLVADLQAKGLNNRKSTKRCPTQKQRLQYHPEERKKQLKMN